MEEKNMREISMDEMDRVSGGTVRQDYVEYWVKDHPCPRCRIKGADFYKLMEHSISSALIRCLNCSTDFVVRM